MDAKEEDLRSGAILVSELVTKKLALFKMFRVRDLKNNVIVADGMLHVQDADRWVNENVGRPNEEGNLEKANVLVEEY